MATSTLESIEYVALAGSFSKLVIAFKASHLRIASELVTKGVIPKDVLDKALTLVGVDEETKATLIVKSALDQVQVCPRKYYDFMTLPGFNDPCHHSLHEEITNVYGKLTQHIHYLPWQSL